jgi:hypothetical protein
MEGSVNSQNYSAGDSHLDDDPFEIDTTVAHPARRYNYWLGGTENFEADRISGDAGAAVVPSIRISVRENRRFLRRSVSYLAAEAGMRQFLDIGTGIPAADNVHEVAQRVVPDARVVYVDNDAIVLAHAHRLLAASEAGATAYIHGDLREPDAIFRHPDLRATLDPSRPVALLLFAVMHFVLDADDPYGHVARLTEGLPPGSYLAMSHATADFMPSQITDDDVGGMTQRVNVRSRDQFQFRDRAAFARFFDGMDLVPPGIESISDWRSELPPGQRPSAADTLSYGAVARIP